MVNKFVWRHRTGHGRVTMEGSMSPRSHLCDVSQDGDLHVPQAAFTARSSDPRQVHLPHHP